MMVGRLLQAISQAGGHVTVDNGDLLLKAARPLPEDLLAELKCHKPDERRRQAVKHRLPCAR